MSIISNDMCWLYNIYKKWFPTLSLGGDSLEWIDIQDEIHVHIDRYTLEIHID